MNDKSESASAEQSKIGNPELSESAERNQCDGCQAGIPLVNGAHRMGKPGGYADTMSCQSGKYASAEPSAPVCEQCRGEGRVGGAAPDEGGGKNCPACDGTGVIDDGEITGVCGVEFENGPVECIKDCPSCTPSAPVERDERAEFEAHYADEFSNARSPNVPFTAADVKALRSGEGYGDRAYLNGQWKGWQARAALERK